MDFKDTSYAALIEDLFSRHPSVQNAGFNTGAYKPGLAGMMRFDESLGSPWRRFRTIHVAGTNGKGSVSSMLAAALAATGLKVGLYTSPHLVDFRERIKIISLKCEDNSGKTSASIHPSQPVGWAPPVYEATGDHGSTELYSAHPAGLITKEAVWEFLTEQNLEGLSFFEITTGMAFWWFARQNVDAAVIEVGLGGRLDSTNIITPELSIVTSIGLDHCAMLGDTRAKIAAEKAGIFKPGVPALVATTDDETAPVFERVAKEVHCPLFFADELRDPFYTEVLPPHETSASLHPSHALRRGPLPFTKSRVITVSEEGEPSALDLEGPCQTINLRTVLAALDLMGVEADMDAICHTAAITGFHGRWERLMDKPEVICDIGHNPAALEMNFKRLADLGRPLFIVYGIMADKDLDGIAPLMPSGARYFLAAPATERSLKVGALHDRLRALRPELMSEAAPSVAEAVRLAVEAASGTPGALVYIGGSTFVVSEAVTSFHINV